MNVSELKRKIMDLVARSDQSVLQLRQKLEFRAESEHLEQALEWAQKQTWFAPSEQLSKKVSDQLARRGQGLHKINQKLKSLGLNPATGSDDAELEKAKLFFNSKWAQTLAKLNFNDLEFNEKQKLKAKIIRSFISRGFEDHIFNEVLKTELQVGSYDHEEY